MTFLISSIGSIRNHAYEIFKKKTNYNEKWFCISGLGNLGDVRIYELCIKHFTLKNEDDEFNYSNKLCISSHLLV